MKASKIIEGAMLAAAAGTAAATGKFFNDVVCREKCMPPIRRRTFRVKKDRKEHVSPYQDVLEEGKKWLKKMEPQSEYFMLQSFDGLTLTARMIPADKDCGRVVLAVHGYKGSGEKDYAVMARMFHEAGYHVLLVDNRAHGASEGKYVGFGCLDKEDCYRWIQHLNRRFKGKCDIFLHGVSMGAATVLMASELNLPPAVKGIVADSPYTSPMEVFEAVASGRKGGKLAAKAVLTCGDILCRIKAGYGFLDCSAEEAVTKTRIPIFLIHGERDRMVPPEMSERIYHACVSPKKLWIAKKAGHLEVFYKYPREYRRRVLEFYEACENGSLVKTEKESRVGV